MLAECLLDQLHNTLSSSTELLADSIPPFFETLEASSPLTLPFMRVAILAGCCYTVYRQRQSITVATRLGFTATWLEESVSNLLEPLFREKPLKQGENQGELDRLGSKFEIPDEYLCLISTHVMDDPVYAPGLPQYKFEKHNIEIWLNKHNFHPYTKTPLEAKDLISDEELKKEIEQFVKAKKAVSLNPLPNVNI